MVVLDLEKDIAVVRRAEGIAGNVSLPADKSIAHRSALFAALGDGNSKISNYPASADPQSTLSCIRQLGIQITQEGEVLSIEGRGLEGLQASSMPLDCGNSGTTMRLLAGIMAGQKFASVLEGDPSLSRRPMERIARPLREMGAHVELTNGHAPIHITPAEHLRGIKYSLPMPSAQVKSCVLLAGLYANGSTTVIETASTRDHTERMLGLSALEMSGQRHLTVKAGLRIPARHWIVPRDFSAAAFFIVAGAIASRGQLILDKVGLNLTRSALLDVLRAMGCRLWVTNEADHGGEPVGTITVRPSELNGVVVQGDVIPILIDEVPILAVAAAAAHGRTEIRDAMELRVKESDRIRAIVDNLRRLGAEVEEFDDGFAVEGGKTLRGTLVQAFDDHRIAMAMGVAGLVAEGETIIEGASCAAVSFPGFWDELGMVVGGEK